MVETISIFMLFPSLSSLSLSTSPQHPSSPSSFCCSGYTDKTATMEGKVSMSMKMRRSISEKAMAQKKEERLLVDIKVLGSTGPIRLVVKGDENATSVIETALKIYARQGRLPVLGSDAHSFLLYPPHAGFQPLNPWDKIGSGGARSFVISKKQGKLHITEARSEIICGNKTGWRAWLQNS